MTDHYLQNHIDYLVDCNEAYFKRPLTDEQRAIVGRTVREYYAQHGRIEKKKGAAHD
jgi:hypothetical protein